MDLVVTGGGSSGVTVHLTVEGQILGHQVPTPVVRTLGPSREVHLSGVGTPVPRSVPGLTGYDRVESVLGIRLWEGLGVKVISLGLGVVVVIACGSFPDILWSVRLSYKSPLGLIVEEGESFEY